MVTCGRQPFNMLPTMAPINPFVVALTPSSVAAAAAAAASLAGTNVTTTTTMAGMTSATKPKLAFSIDSIVGAGAQEERRSTLRPAIISPPLSSSQRSDSPEERERGPPFGERAPSRHSLCEEAHAYAAHPHCQQPLELRNSLTVYNRALEAGQAPPMPTARGLIYCRRRSTLDRSPERDACSPVRCRSRSPLSSSQLQQQQQRGRSRSPTPNRNTPQSPQPPTGAGTALKGPIIVPGLPAGLIRPLPLQAPPNLALVQPSPSPNETNAGGHQAPLSSTASSHPVSAPLPPTIPHGVVGSSAQPPPPHGAPPPNPHFLAAQFQMAAALAHHHHQQQQQHHPPPHLPPGHPMSIFPPGPHHPHFGGPPIIRDSYPLYPWLLSRHGRLFPHRFPGNFLLQPFRKPKRVRTAFSPTQLLKLEHAFEGNHYVVGAERKQLAQGLSLTETQVKVWFQNRRTKHKRMQQEGDSDSKSNKGSNAGDNDGKNDSSQNSFEDQEEEEDDDLIEDEDEVIDMDDYGSEMDAEEQQRMREQFQQQLQQHQEHMQQQMQQQQQHQQREAPSREQMSQQQQQFMQHQLYLQQQAQQAQQQQQQQRQQP